MALFLAQHGVNLSKDLDPAKGLAQKGREQTVLIAKVVKNYEISVSKILHSGLERAEQTAQIFNDILMPDLGLEKSDGLAPLDDVAAFSGRIDPSGNVMLVGHLPFMDRLVSYLTAGDPELSVYRFQNSGIVCLDFENDNWFIKWTINPNIS